MTFVSAQKPAIAGSWINGAAITTTGQSFDVINPATGETLAEYDTLSDAGVEAAVILDGRIPHAMLLEIFTARGAGTLIHR